MHNVLTLRGALVRDARVWAAYIDEAISLFAGRADVQFAQHHWPRWGRERIVDLLAKQRDLYAYIHDQTLRLLNKGHTASEIAEHLELPPALEREWHCRGYYGSLSHNVKAVAQRYLGWFDGNPATLWPHPPVEAARRYVALAGGEQALLDQARAAYERGDHRWVAELAGHAVFANPGNRDARELQALAFEQLAYGAENATWRNFFLMGALELREGVAGTATSTAPADFVRNLSTAQLFDALAIRLDGPRAGDSRVVLRWSFSDRGELHEMVLGRGVITHRLGTREPACDATLTLDRPTLDALLTGALDAGAALAAQRLTVDGDASKLGLLLGLLDAPDPAFPIVTPRAPLQSAGSAAAPA
jgi:alkyl sulfatase BDS1-like metallo-beta-lactamase superfamily hydrolase